MFKDLVNVWSVQWVTLSHILHKRVDLIKNDKDDFGIK